MRVLQLGHEDWSHTCDLPADMEWTFVDVVDGSGFDPLNIGGIDATVVDAWCDLALLESLEALITPYTLIVAREHAVRYDDSYRKFFRSKAVSFQDAGDRQALVDDIARKYFARPFGQKLEIGKALVSPFHASDSWFEGNTYLATTIDQAEFRQLVIWKENIPYESHRALELWPEYLLDPGCEVELRVQLIQTGTPDVILLHETYSQADMAEPIVLSHPISGYLSCSIFARGSGEVKVGPIHYRHSRLGAGHFLPGGQRIVDSRREELFHYFHPGNLEPPLNIYFAGYRPAEGFEGYFMMASLGHPFLLVTDPRLEGGRFYLGSEELESQLLTVIHRHINDLGFREQDVIFSGLSMGSFGALYYGSQLDAHAIIAGKPIVDLGHVAERGRLVRPNDFLTIFDVVSFWNRARDGADATVEAFTSRLLDRWSGDSGFGDTKILLSYMAQDDYDDEAYYTLLRSQTGKATTVIARGYQGRHNDDSPSIVAWFSRQYHRIIAEYVEARRGI